MDGSMRIAGRWAAGTMRRIRPEEVDRAVEAAAAMLDARSASKVVGISEGMIERLGRAGVLRAEAVSVGGRRTMRYGRPTLEAFAARLAGVATEGGGPADPVRLTDLAARRQVSTLTVLDRVLEGDLRCFRVPADGDGRILAAFAVSAEEALLAPGREIGGVSVREAAKAIGVNVRMVPILVGPRMSLRRSRTVGPARSRQAGGSLGIGQFVSPLLRDDVRDRAVARDEHARRHFGTPLGRDATDRGGRLRARHLRRLAAGRRASGVTGGEMSGGPGPGLRLPVRVEPVSGESFAGFMLRTAEANRYPEPKWLIPPGMHGPALVNPLDPALILGWLGHGAEAARNLGSVRVERFRTRIGAGSTIWTAAADLKRPKVCPACIRKRGIMRSVWDLRYYTACAEHGCRMLHTCPRCGRQIDWKRTRLDRCCPDAGFGEAEVELAPARTVGLMRAIEVASGTMAAADDGGFGGLVAGMGLSDLLSLIRTLAAASASDTAVSTIMADTAPDRAAAAAHAAAAAVVLAGWPDSLHAIIRRQASRSGEIGSTEVRRVFPILSDAAKQPAFAFLRREFESFVGNQYTDWIRTPQRRPLVAEYKEMRADEAAGILGMNAWTVVCRAKSGDIPGRCADIRGQQTWFFSKHEVEEVREREWTHVDVAEARKSRGALTLTEAAAMLGLSLPNARDLAAAGLLGPQDVPVHFIRYFDQRRIPGAHGPPGRADAGEREVRTGGRRPGVCA